MKTTDETRPAPSATQSQYRKPAGNFSANDGPHFTALVHVRSAISGHDRPSEPLPEVIRAITTTADGSVRLRSFSGFALNYQLTNHSPTQCRPSKTTPHPGWLTMAATACVAMDELARWSLPSAGPMDMSNGSRNSRSGKLYVSYHPRNPPTEEEVVAIASGSSRGGRCLWSSEISVGGQRLSVGLEVPYRHGLVGCRVVQGERSDVAPVSVEVLRPTG